MKLYTEEQILFYLTIHSSAITRYDLHNIPHIELPSDGEIYINANVNSANTEQHLGFIKGIQHMRELIEKNKV